MHKGRRTSPKSLIRFQCGFHARGKGVITYWKASFLCGFQQFVCLERGGWIGFFGLRNVFCHIVCSISCNKLSQKTIRKGFPVGSEAKNLPAVQETQETWAQSRVGKMPWGRESLQCSFLPAKAHGQRNPVRKHGGHKGRTRRSD